MSGFQLNSITAAGEAATANIVSALIPRQHASTVSAKISHAADSSNTQNTSSSDSSNGDISASDFLTLLVTELKNQDPTQPTDPNAYITQLVGVNSLQQLIQINAGVSAIGAPSSAPDTGAAGN